MFTTEPETAELGEGRMATPHAGVPHSIYAPEEAVFLLTLAVTTVKEETHRYYL